MLKRAAKLRVQPAIAGQDLAQLVKHGAAPGKSEQTIRVAGIARQRKLVGDNGRGPLRREMIDEEPNRRRQGLPIGRIRLGHGRSQNRVESDLQGEHNLDRTPFQRDFKARIPG